MTLADLRALTQQVRYGDPHAGGTIYTEAQIRHILRDLGPELVAVAEAVAVLVERRSIIRSMSRASTLVVHPGESEEDAIQAERVAEIALENAYATLRTKMEAMK